MDFTTIPFDTFLLIFLEALALDIILSLFPIARDRVPALGGVPVFAFLPLVKRLNRKERGDATLIARSFFVLLVALGFSAALGYILSSVIRTMPYGSLGEVVIVFSCLVMTRPWRVVPPLIKRVKAGDKTAVQQGITLLLRHRSHHMLSLKKPDAHALARVSIEDMAVLLSRGVVAPAFWYLVPLFSGYLEAGLIALVIYTTVTELRRMLFSSFGDTAFERPIGFIDETLHYIPARITAMLIWLAALFTPSGNAYQAIRCVYKQAGLSASPASGWLLASFAGALHVVLSGGHKGLSWIGPDNASAKATDKDIKRAFWLYNITVLLVLGILFILLYHALSPAFFRF